MSNNIPYSGNDPRYDPYLPMDQASTGYHFPIQNNNNSSGSNRLWNLQNPVPGPFSSLGFNYFQTRYPMDNNGPSHNNDLAYRSDPKRPRVNSSSCHGYYPPQDPQMTPNRSWANNSQPHGNLQSSLPQNNLMDIGKNHQKLQEDQELIGEIEEWLELEGDSLLEEDYTKSENCGLFSVPRESFSKWLDLEYEKDCDLLDDDEAEGKSSIGSSDYDKTDSSTNNKTILPNNGRDFDLALLLEVSVKHDQMITELIEQFIPKLTPHIAELNLRLNKLKKKALEEFPTSITNYGQIPDEILLSTSILCRSPPNQHPLCAPQLIDDRDEHQLLPLDTGDPVDRAISVLCVLLENWLFHLVDWVEQTDLFKNLPVEDKMQILYSSWSELLILEFIHIYCEQISHLNYEISSPPMSNSPPKRNCKSSINSSLSNLSSKLGHNPDNMSRIQMTTSENNPESLLEPVKFISIVDDLIKTLLLKEVECRQKLDDLICQCQIVHFDTEEFTVLKFLSVFNLSKHDLKLSQQSRQYIKRVQSELCQFLIRRSRRIANHKAKCSHNTTEYNQSPADITLNGANRFGHTLLALSEVKGLAYRLETHLLNRFYSGSIPRESLLFEMLFTKRERYANSARAKTDPNMTRTDVPDSESINLNKT